MDPAAIFAQTPSNVFLGMQLIARTAEQCTVELPVRQDFLQEAGVVQGGFVTALADITAVYLLWPDLQPARTMTSIEFKMNFLSAALPDREPLRAVAVPLRIGKTVAVCESTVFQGDRLVAKGTFTYLVRERRLPT